MLVIGGAEPSKPAAPSDLLQQVRQNRRLLWRARIEPPVETTVDNTLESISEWLERMHQARTRRMQAVQQDATVPSPSAIATPKTAKQPGQVKTLPVQRKISPELLSQFTKLTSREPARQIALGDSLFQSGYLDAAFRIYEQAMTKDMGKQDMAWSLFQMANCRRNSDPAAALKFYQRLIVEYPDSPWQSIAVTGNNLMKWREINKPDAALQRVSQPTN